MDQNILYRVNRFSLSVLKYIIYLHGLPVTHKYYLPIIYEWVRLWWSIYSWCLTFVRDKKSSLDHLYTYKISIFMNQKCLIQWYLWKWHKSYTKIDSQTENLSSLTCTVSHHEEYLKDKSTKKTCVITWIYIYYSNSMTGPAINFVTLHRVSLRIGSELCNHYSFLRCVH